MWYIDDAQKKRYWKSPTLTDYKVCLVTVCSFTFIFHAPNRLKCAWGIIVQSITLLVVCLLILKALEITGRHSVGLNNFHNTYWKNQNAQKLLRRLRRH